VGVPLGDRNFGDVNVIFIAAQCAATDPDWSATTTPCMPGMDHYNYPSIWAKAFGLLHADPTWTSPFALLLMALFTISLIPLTYFALGTKSPWKSLTGMTLVAVTPPVWLAFERGNIDLLMFFLISLSIFLWVQGAGKTSGLLIGAAATLKVFPAGAILMLLSPQRTRRGPLITVLVTGAIGLALIARDLSTISARTPQIDGASFGIGLLPLLGSNQLDLDLDATVARLIGIVVFGLGLVVAWALVAKTARTLTRRWKEVIEQVSVDPVTTALVLAGSGVFLVAYLLGPSYDYRLIFLIPAIAGLLRLGSTIALVGASLLITQMIFSYSTFVGPREYVSDLMLLLIAPLLALGSWSILRQVQT